MGSKPAPRPGEHGNVVGGTVVQGSFVVSTDSQPASCATTSGSEVVLDTGAKADLASFARLRNHHGLLKQAGNGEAAPHPTMARSKFGNGQTETAKHAADAPIVLAATAEVLRRSWRDRTSRPP